MADPLKGMATYFQGKQYGENRFFSDCSKKMALRTANSDWSVISKTVPFSTRLMRRRFCR